MSIIYTGFPIDYMPNAVMVPGSTVDPSLLPPGGALDRAGAAARVIRFVNPALHEAREAGARVTKAESYIAAADRLRKEFPCMSERRAAMEAMGYRMTNEQADNVVSVLDEAQGILDSRGREARGLLPETRDAIFEGSRGAYGETARRMWARAAAEEAAGPGTFARRDLSIISAMRGDDVELFERLCSTSIRIDRGKSAGLHAVLAADDAGGTYNHGLLSANDLDALASLGLITASSWVDMAASGKTTFLLPVQDSVAFVTNPSDEDRVFRFSSMRFLREGESLSALCEVGTSPSLKEAIGRVLAAAGLTVEWVRAPLVARGSEG